MGSRPLEGWRGYIYNLPIIFILICSSLGVNTVLAVEHTHVIFEDGFDKGASEAWRIWSPPDAPEGSGWAVLYDGGNNVLRLKGNVFAEAGDREWTNYTVEVRLKFVEGLDEAHVSVRVGQPAPRYFFRFTDDGLFLTKEKIVRQGEESEFIDLASAAMERWEEKWYSVRIVCDGPRLTIYIDDAPMLDLLDADAPILTGKVALESGPQSVIYFDDVRVLTTHDVFIGYLLDEALREINAAREAYADTGEAENIYEKAETKLKEGDLPGAERLAKEAKSLAEAAKAAASEPQPQQSASSGSFWPIEVVAGVVSIGAAGVGVVGWCAGFIWLASGGFGACEGFLGRDEEVDVVEIGASGRIQRFP